MLFKGVALIKITFLFRQILFITKAITLAQNENLPELSVNLIELLSWIKEQIRQSQNFLNHDLREGLYTEEDDDDDDF